jgi:hypothetical protein
LIAPETLETRRLPQHLVPLLGQRTMLPCAFLLSGHADRKHLLGFLPRGNTAQGWQAKGDASGILGLAHAVWLGHPKERCDGIGADGHADVIEPECAGNSSRQACNLAKGEPLLAPPAGESLSSRSAQVHKRCTCIKRALVRTGGGATHARIVCVSFPETRSQADRNVAKLG